MPPETKQKEQEKISREQKSKEKQIWLTVYSDMTTNLALFFLILFSITRLSAPQREKLYESLKKQYKEKTKQEEVQVVKEEEQKKKDVDELKKLAYVEETQQQIKITLPSPVLFDLNKVELKTQAMNILSQIATVLKGSDYPIIVEGHTDNLPVYGGRYPSNWHLSSARAFSVIEYFVNEGKINPKRFSAMGYAEYRPVVPNDTEENRSINRRIEIIVVKI
ncbi:MAG: OmpA family protein [Elusimicrobia bacterium]|nr:OmpA family protein [Elusimicrobiota bacterium]